MGFFDSLWSGIKSVGSFIVDKIKPVANAISNSGIPVVSSIGKGVSDLISMGEHVAGKVRTAVNVGKRIAGGLSQFVGKRTQNLKANPVMKHYMSRDFQTQPVAPEVPVAQFENKPDTDTQELYAG